jgi:hypothetical protein
MAVRRLVLNPAVTVASQVYLHLLDLETLQGRPHWSQNFIPNLRSLDLSIRQRIRNMPTSKNFAH